MNKNEILKRLENKINIVYNPDHPNVLNGPDIMAYSNSFIYGIFFFLKVANKEIEDAQIRLAETTLNYPSKQLNYLVIEDESIDSYLVKKFENLFSRVITINELFSKSLFREKKNENFRKNIKNVQLKYLEETSKSYNYNLDLIDKLKSRKFEKNYKRLKELFKNYEKSVYKDYIHENSIKVRSNIYNVNKKIYAFKNIDNKTPDKIDIKPYYYFALFNNVELTKEFIDFKIDTIKYFDVDKIPTLPSDPFKLVRILSSGGWKLVLENDMENIIYQDSDE